MALRDGQRARRAAHVENSLSRLLQGEIRIQIHGPGFDRVVAEPDATEHLAAATTAATVERSLVMRLVERPGKCQISSCSEVICDVRLRSALAFGVTMQFDFWTIVCFVLIFGFFGGVSSYFAFCIYGADGGFKNKFDTDTKLGSAILFSAMNGIVGVAGAFAIQVLLLAMRFYDKSPTSSDFIYLASICLIGGFAARSFLNQVSQMLARQINQKIEETKQLAERTVDTTEEQAMLFVLLLDSMTDNSPPRVLEFVVKTADSALKKNPNDATFIVAKGAALKRLKKVQEAIDTLTPYIETHGSVSKPDKYISSAFYNRACYNALLNKTEPALNDLKRALELSENVSRDKQFAAEDADFKNLRDNPKFQELVN
jgi:hypothetical protein